MVWGVCLGWVGFKVVVVRIKFKTVGEKYTKVLELDL